MSSEQITKSIGKLSKQSFGQGKQFIVDGDNTSPTGVQITWAYALTDITGLNVDSSNLLTGSADFPTDLVAGIELPAGLYNISVTTGYLLCFIG